ncbi:MAG TPA: hypothetical protein VGI75_05130 [Pirellulales bacterium]|jgi:ethanolamine utilization protein EutP (predicted NTPase)
MATVDLAEIRDLADLIERVSKGESLLIRNGNNDVGVLISTHDPQLLEAVEDYLDNQAADVAIAEGGDPIPYDQLRRELGLA